jgi:hypothetical protein
VAGQSLPVNVHFWAIIHHAKERHTNKEQLTKYIKNKILSYAFIPVLEYS